MSDTKWIKVAPETMPEADEEVLIYFGGIERMDFGYWDGSDQDGWWWIKGEESMWADTAPTHWMLKPDAPQ